VHRPACRVVLRWDSALPRATTQLRAGGCTDQRRAGSRRASSRLRANRGRHPLDGALAPRAAHTELRRAVTALPRDRMPTGVRSRAGPPRLQGADAQTKVPRGVTARAWAGVPTQEAMGCASPLSGTPAPGGMTPVAARLWRPTWSGPAASLPQDPGAGNDEKSGSCPLPRGPHA
jgi:hypothetical protein